MVSYSETVE